MSTDYRALCAELVADWDSNKDDEEFLVSLRDLIDRARAALAQPEPQGPSDEELLEAFDQAVAAFPPVHSEAESLSAVEYARELEIRKARAVLARWGRPAITPVPVSERLPEPVGPTDEELVKHYGRSVTSAIDSRVAMHLLTDEDLDAATAAGLRDRLAALEAQRETEKACIQEIYDKLDRLKVQHESNCQDSLDSSPAPAGGLVREVAWRVAAFASEAKAGDDATPTARAAVLAVADWLEGIRAIDTGMSARWLREEVERG